jgi:hypothetical protein
MPPGLPPRRTDSTGYLFGLRGSIWRSTEAANVRSGLLPPSSFLPARCLTGFDVFGGGFSYLLVLTVILRCGRSPNPTPTLHTSRGCTGSRCATNARNPHMVPFQIWHGPYLG